MDEERARALLELVADTLVRPEGADIDLARSRGRTRLRWRRACVVGAPALAVVGVFAAAAFGASRPLTTSPVTAPSKPDRVTAARVAPPKRFSPLIPYVAFGWLPRGVSLDGGQLAATTAYLTAGHSSEWALTVYSAGRCNLTSQQVLGQLRKHKKPELTCSVSSSGGWSTRLSSVAKPVHGHLAFWTPTGALLAWQYARGSWATLTRPGGHAALGEAVKIADHIKYAVATRPSIEFPLQLSGLPPASRVTATYFVAHAGVLRAAQYSLAGAGSGSPNFTVGRSTRRSSCYFYAGQSGHRTINGYRVTVNHLKAVRGNPPIQQVCAPDADGLMIFISTYGAHAAPDAIAIFAHHTRLLGTNPKDWTTRPLR